MYPFASDRAALQVCANAITVESRTATLATRLLVVLLFSVAFVDAVTAIPTCVKEDSKRLRVSRVPNTVATTVNASLFGAAIGCKKRKTCMDCAEYDVCEKDCILYSVCQVKGNCCACSGQFCFNCIKQTVRQCLKAVSSRLL
jgi:hypothetical protein